MPHLVRVPKPDENTEDVTLAEWFVDTGDSIRHKDNIVKCIADKGDFEIWHDGEDGKIIARSNAAPGSLVPVGHILVAVGTAADSEPVPDIDGMNAELAQQRHGRIASPSSTAAQVRATPSARRLAKENNIDLADVKKKLSIEGAIKPEDVKRFLELRFKN